jgi:hypothetical protein
MHNLEGTKRLPDDLPLLLLRHLVLLVVGEIERVEVGVARGEHLGGSEGVLRCDAFRSIVICGGTSRRKRL